MAGRGGLMKSSYIVFLIIFYYVFLLAIVIVVVNWILLYSDRMVLIARSIITIAVLILVAVKYPELLTAEFIVGDVYSGNFTRHGIFFCKILCYQFSAKYGSFNPLPLLTQAKRIYLVKRRGGVFLVVEVHSLTKMFLKKKLEKIDRILSSVLYSCRVSKVCLKEFKAYFKEAKLFSEDKIDNRALYLIESLELPDCVIVVSEKYFGLYYFAEGLFKRHLLSLKPKYKFTEPLLSILVKKLFEEMYSTQTVTVSSSPVIGYRMIGDYISGEKVFFDTRGHVLIVGKTGSGKTTLLANLIDCYRQNKYNIIVLDSFGELASLGSEVVAGVNFFINPFDFMEPDEVLDIVEKTSVLFYRKMIHHSTIKTDKIETQVDLIKCCAGMDDKFLRVSADSGAKGIVIEGMGRGNVPPKVFEGVKYVIEKKGIPVVLVSRCPRGRVLDTYAYYGGGRMLRELGVIFGENLPGHKARIKLMLALGSTDNYEKIKQIFEGDRYAKFSVN